MDDSANASPHFMLITPGRVFYTGLLGRPRRRCSGAFHVYVAIRGGLRLSIEGAGEACGELAVVPPNVPHTIASDHRSVICVLVEPESVTAGTLVELSARLSGPSREWFVGRIRAAYVSLQSRDRRNDVDCFELDRMCFGGALPPRSVDPRVQRAIGQILRFSGEPVTAADCATAIGLSTSRFLHLFKQETGISFRAFRAWKRARHLLNFANQDVNLAHLAQDIGYPDSTHFSHSIRRFYGLKPRAIFSGSRDLAIYRSAPTDSAWTQEAG